MAAPAPAHANAEWAVRLVEFNVHVARFAHRSWYPQVLSAVLFDAHGRIDARAEPKVSDWLLRESHLSRDMDWRMDEPQKRLWLLDGPSLERLTRELALAMHRDSLAQVIDGARARALQCKLDPSLWRFLIEEVPEGLFQHRTPVVDFGGGASEIEAALREEGARTLIALLQPAWRAVRGRAQLRFDSSLAGSRIRPLPAAHCERALELIRAHLIPRRLPQWAWLF